MLVFHSKHLWVRVSVSVNARDECERTSEYKFALAWVVSFLKYQKADEQKSLSRKDLIFLLNLWVLEKKMVSSVKHVLALALFAVLASTGEYLV